MRRSVCSCARYGNRAPAMVKQAVSKRCILACSCCQQPSSSETAGQGCVQQHSASYFTASAAVAATQTVNSSTSPAVSAGLQQERINADGSLSTAHNWYRQQWKPHSASPASTTGTADGKSSLSQQQSTCSTSSNGVWQQQEVRPPALPAAAPAAAPISRAQLDQLADMVQSSRRVMVITGAGCSTESNIPDYRGPGGAYTTGFTPMTHQQFVAKPENRSR